MRVLRIVPYLDFGGLEQVLSNSVPLLIESSKMKVMIIVLGNGGRVEKELLIKGVSVILFNQNPRIPNFKIILKLFNSIKSFKPDVVHCQAAEANFHGLIAARMAGVPVRIGEEIGFPNHHSYWKYIFRLVYKNATKVIAISQAVKDRIVELGEVEAEKVEVVYNPVSLGERLKGENLSRRISGGKRGIEEGVENSGEEENIEDFSPDIHRDRNDKEKPLNFSEADSDGSQLEGEKPIVFVTTCRLVPVKNLDRLITAFARLCNEFSSKSMELWIVGDGPLRESLENHSKVLRVSDKVKFWGFQENVYPFLENSDVFVLPSLSEGSSVSLVEAMSVGLPSIVTKVGGTQEIIGGSESAFFIDPLNEESIFNSLMSFIKLSDIDKFEIGKRSINESKRFSTKNYIKKLKNVYLK